MTINEKTENSIYSHDRAPTVSLSQNFIAGLTALFDIAISFATGLAIYWLYLAAEEPEKLNLYLTAISLNSLLLVQSFYMAGLYRFSNILSPYRQLVFIFGLSSFLFLFLTACAFALKISSDFSRVWAFSYLLTNVAGIALARFTLYRMVRKLSTTGTIARKIAIFGSNEQSARLIQHIKRLDEPWNRIVGVFDDRTTRIRNGRADHPLRGGTEQLVDWCRLDRADEVLIALPWRAHERIMSIVDSLAPLPVNVRLSPEFIGADMLHRRTTNQFSVPMLSILEKPVSGWGAITKSLLDYLLATTALIVTSPLLLLVICAIKIDSPGPVFFRQRRYGFNNQLIEIFKFRSMYADQADHDAEKITVRGDPRVTRVGAILRRFSIDEIPQIFNVLAGEMSIVGPRPHALKAKAGGVLYEDVVDRYAVRHKVKPGLTGWAQVNGWRGDTHDEAALIGRIEHDLYYIDNWSVAFDLSIILRTVAVVLRGENSY